MASDSEWEDPVNIYEQGLEFEQEGDRDQAFGHFLEAAPSHAGAMNRVGEFHQSGVPDVVGWVPEKAMECFEHIYACCTLCCWCLRRHGPP